MVARARRAGPASPGSAPAINALSRSGTAYDTYDTGVLSVPVFCFPHAGGGASQFRTWSKQWPSWVTLYPVELPGREHRLSDRAFRHLAPLVAALVHALAPYVHRPFVFYGHSMGALIAFELARLLQATAGVQPSHLFVSACQAPHRPLRRPPIHTLPDAAFIREMRRINGTPAEILDCSELMDLMLPTLRADFTLCETYVYRPGPPLRCPISAFGGVDDSLVPREDLLAWQEHTQGSFAVRFMAGGHFFPHQEGDALLNAMLSDLRLTMSA
jgi:medium-chain acyl-[acyl-carrier-protein] hydrolase